MIEHHYRYILTVFVLIREHCATLNLGDVPLVQVGSAPFFYCEDDGIQPLSMSFITSSKVYANNIQNQKGGSQATDRILQFSSLTLCSTLFP